MLGVLGVGALIFAANLVGGSHGGVLYYVGLGRNWTWLLTLALLALMLAMIGFSIKGRWDGIFIGPRNKISLSRFQLVIWTVVIGGALLTAGLSNVSVGSDKPLEIDIPKELWALLGLGGFTFVASPAILTQKERGGDMNVRLDQINKNLQAKDQMTMAITAIGPVVQKGSTDDARWLDMFRGDEADADLIDFSKVQQFLFTTLLVVIYAAALASHFAGLEVLAGFPAIDKGFLALLGISHAAYLGYKISPKN